MVPSYKGLDAGRVQRPRRLAGGLGDLFPTDFTEDGETNSVVGRMTIGGSYRLWVDGRDGSRVYLSLGQSPWPCGSFGSVPAASWP